MATLLTQSYNLNLIPGQNIVIVNAAAYDNSPRLIRFNMYNGSQQIDVSQWSARIEGTRQGTQEGFSTTATVSGSVVSFAITNAMTASSGKHQAVVVFFQGNDRVASATFILNVSPAVLDESTPATDEDNTIYQQWIAANTNQVQQNATDIAILSARMDEFASLPSGSTAGNAELVDIRVGDDGVTYPTAGDAVRGQVRDLKTAIKQLGRYERFEPSESGWNEFVFALVNGVTYTLTNNTQNWIDNISGRTNGVSTLYHQGVVAKGESITFTATKNDATLYMRINNANGTIDVESDGDFIALKSYQDRNISDLSNALQSVCNERDCLSSAVGFNDFVYPITAGRTYTFKNTSQSGTIGNIYSFTGNTQHILRESGTLAPGQTFSVTATYSDTNIRIYFSLPGMTANVKDDNTKVADIERQLNELGDTTKLVPDSTHFVYGGSSLVSIAVSSDERNRIITRESGTGSNLGCLIGTIETNNLGEKLVLKIDASAEGALTGVYLASSPLNWATKLARVDNIRYGKGENIVVLDVSEINKQTYPTAYLWVHLPDTDTECVYEVGYIYKISIAAEMAIKSFGAGSYNKYSWNAVGDSITEQAKYLNIIKTILGIPYTNDGISSSTIAINNTYLQAQSIVEKVCGLNGNTPYTDADVWTINGGLNDVLYQSGLGSISPSGSTFDNTTVYGALQTIVENIMDRRAHPRLILVTPTHSVRDTWSKATYGITIDEIRQAMIDVGEYYGVPVVDLWALGGINAFNMQKQTNPTTSDGVHPTDAGAALMAMPICNAIKDVFYDS